MKLQLAAVAYMAALTLTAPAAAVADGVNSTTSGNYSELTNLLHIQREPGRFTPVMHLFPSALYSFRSGDAVRFSAELSVTTDCTHPLPRCAGRPYVFDPVVDTRLVVMAHGVTTTVARDTSRCVQQPGDRQHHCIVTFPWKDETGVVERRCPNGNCEMYMLARTHNPRAEGGEVLVVGSQDERGRLKGDKGRINAIRTRGAVETERLHADLGRDEVPPDLKRRVVLSQRIDGLRKGDVIEATLGLRGDVSNLPYPALIGSQLVLAEGPRDVHGHRFVSKAARLNGELNEGAGTNCTQAQTPCPIQRVGVVEMLRDSVSPGGRDKPLFLNLVIRANNKLKPERPGDMVRLVNADGLDTTIYRDIHRESG